MAGTFGLKAPHFGVSKKIGEKLFLHLRHPDIEAGLTECSACSLQLSHHTAKPVYHPILLSFYGGSLPDTSLVLAYLHAAPAPS